MFKQLSTYGALLLATMILVRAKIIVDEGNVSELYERQADNNFQESNLNLLTSNSIETKTFEHKNKVNIDVKSMHHSTYVPHKNVAIIASKNMNIRTKELNEPTQIADVVAVTEEENSLSLDSENTINSNLSLLFPRQQIQPRSNRENLNR